MRRSLVLPLLAAACGSTPKDPRDEALEKDREQRYQEAIAKKEIRLGMTPKMVVAAWGEPQKRDRTTRNGKEVRRWWYPSVFVYFHEDGYVLGWDAPY
jgi:hypothetical protein